MEQQQKPYIFKNKCIILYEGTWDGVPYSGLYVRPSCWQTRAAFCSFQPCSEQHTHEEEPYHVAESISQNTLKLCISIFTEILKNYGKKTPIKFKCLYSPDTAELC